MDRSITRGGGSSCPSGGIDSLRFVPSSSTLQSAIATFHQPMNAQLDIREEDLPESIADVVKAIGMPATLRLIERYGGSRVYVPQPEHITVDHAIARAIGFDAARALSRLAQDVRIEVPRAAGALRLARDRAILRESRTVSVSRLALKYSLTERQIYQIRSGAP